MKTISEINFSQHYPHIMEVVDGKKVLLLGPNKNVKLPVNHMIGSKNWGAFKIINGKSKVDKKICDNRIMGMFPYKNTNFDKLPFVMTLKKSKIQLLNMKKNKRFTLFKRHSHQRMIMEDLDSQTSLRKYEVYYIDNINDNSKVGGYLSKLTFTK